MTMFRKTLFFLGILLFTLTNNAIASCTDSTNISDLKAYYWLPISDADKVLEHENTKNLTKRTIDQTKLAANNYATGIQLMNNKEYDNAITEFKLAMKRYKRAKLSDDALNYIRTNLALSYANTGNKEDLVVAKRFLDLLTKKVYNSTLWTYNVAIAHAQVGNMAEAASLLSANIRKDEFYFQSYVTLEAIYRDSGNEKDALKVRNRMEIAEAKLIQQQQKNTTTSSKKKNKATEIVFSPTGERPDITNLKIVTKSNHLQYNKIDRIDERSMKQIQEGIGTYNEGVKELSNKEYKLAQSNLKEAEKRLKRGKLTDDGLNFTRGNLAIAYLATGEKRGVGQAKRYLKYITPKLYKSREWTYNLAVAHYEFSIKSRGTTKEDYTNKAIKLFKLSIKQDKLFLPSYQNLIYVYKELDEEKKALKVHRSYEKSRSALMKSFSKKDQASLGLGDPYIFRVNLGTFGEFDTPADLFDEDYLITVPLSEVKTAYLAGMFYNLDEAIAYQKEMTKRGYVASFIVAFKDGEKMEF